MAELTRVPFRARLRVPVGGVVERDGWFARGDEGWGEYSPLASWQEGERAAAERSARECAMRAFPPAVRARVDVNALIPRVSPAVAAEMAVSSGCTTIKVKVGDPDGVDRVAAVRDAMPGARVRLDANGAWDLDTASVALHRLRAYDIELIEDPVASMGDLAQLRLGSSVLIAAESCVRTVADARRVRELRAADALVIKPQRIGGPRAALDAAAEFGGPCIASSALETSVGLAAVLAVAAALPDAPFAHGVGTALLLEDDPVDEPLLPVDGALVPRRVEPRT